MSRTAQIEKMPFSDIIPDSDFVGMTTAQKIWVKVFITLGDAVLATKIAYPKTSARTLPSRVCHVKAHPKIRSILCHVYGKPAPDPLAEDLRRAIRKSIKRDNGLTEQALEAIRFYERRAGKKIGVNANAR